MTRASLRTPNKARARQEESRSKRGGTAQKKKRMDNIKANETYGGREDRKAGYGRYGKQEKHLGTRRKPE